MVAPEDNPEVLMMICTAGHVDHGKTALVRLLTGCETDRLKVEKERGLTIELGFALCNVGDNQSVGIVDTPGHEKFIKNMVSGVSGIGMCILVIAADDGIMPQTVEHLQILELMGVRKGMIALTKIDLVSDDRVESLKTEIPEFLKGTFLEAVPICPVSSETLDGFSEFYQTLSDTIKNAAIEQRSGIFRMPVERVFTQQGFGVVLSGIPTYGSVKSGDTIEVQPGGMKGRIRAMQRFGKDVDEGHYGQCLALNIPEFSKNEPERGSVAGPPGYLKPAQIFYLLIKTVNTLNKPLSNAEQVKFHTGTIEKTGKIYLLGNDQIDPGDEGCGIVVFDSPVMAAEGDRFILRRPSPADTVAGGEIWEVSHEKKRPPRSVVLNAMKEKYNFFEGQSLGNPENDIRRIEYCLLNSKTEGSSISKLSHTLLLTPERIKSLTQDLIQDNRIQSLGSDYYIHSHHFESFYKKAVSHIENLEKNGILSESRPEFRKSVSDEIRIVEAIESKLQSEEKIKVQGDKIIFRGSEDQMEDSEKQLLDKIVTVYEDTGYNSPRPDEIPEMLRIPSTKCAKLIEHLVNTERLIRLDRKVILSHDHFVKAQNKVISEIEKNKKLDSADFKNVIGSSRKYALAILDYLDARGVTIRAGNMRVLAPDYEKRMIR